MWTPLRKEISKICQELAIPEERFKEISIHDWQPIQENIFNKFYDSNREQLKGDTYSIQFLYNYPFDQLLHLVDHDEKVWLFLDETVRERGKFWFYEGYIKDIVKILLETTQSREVYIASKKYEWLLCVNQHDYIIASGKEMGDKLLKLENAK